MKVFGSGDLEKKNLDKYSIKKSISFFYLWPKWPPKWLPKWPPKGHRSDHRSDHRCDHRSDHRSDQRSDHRSDHLYMNSNPKIVRYFHFLWLEMEMIPFIHFYLLEKALGWSRGTLWINFMREYSLPIQIKVFGPKKIWISCRS